MTCHTLAICIFVARKYRGCVDIVAGLLGARKHLNTQNE